MRTTRGQVRGRDFRLFWAGETISALGTSVSKLALPLTAVALHADAFGVAVLTAAGWLPWLLIGLPAGVWVDRLRRRPLMLGCDLVAAALLASVPLAAWTGVLTYAQLLAVALLAGSAGVVFQTAYQVFVPCLVGEQQVVEANAKLQGSESAAQVAGPGLAGLLTGLLGASGGMAADALSYLVSAAGLSLVRRREPPVPTTPRRGLRGEAAEGLRVALRDPYLRVLTRYGALSNLALTGYQSVLVVFLVRDVGLSAGTVGLLLSGMGFGGLVGAAAAGRLARALGTARATLVANLAAGPFALLLPLTSTGARLTLAVVAGCGVGAAVVAGNVLKSSFRQTYVPRDLLGRVLVAMQLVNYGTIPVGALLGGSLAQAFGVRAAMWLMVTGVALAPLALLTGPVRRCRDFPVRAAHRTDLPATAAGVPA